MIDENKIKSAAQGYCDATYGTLDTNPFIAEAFRKGARWAINEFLNDLWHPAEEEPNREAIRTYILGETEVSESGILPMLLRPNTNWKEFVVSHSVTHWLYIDDLLPKEGGNHD